MPPRPVPPTGSAPAPGARPHAVHIIFGGTAEDHRDTLSGPFTGRTTEGAEATTAKAFGQHLPPDTKTHFVVGAGYGGRQEFIDSAHTDFLGEEVLGHAMVHGAKAARELVQGKSPQQLQRDAEEVHEVIKKSGAEHVVLSAFSRGSQGAQVAARHLEKHGTNVTLLNDLDAVHVSPSQGRSYDVGRDGKVVPMAQKDTPYPRNVGHVTQIRAMDESRRAFASPVRAAEDPTATHVTTHDVPGIHGDVGGVEVDRSVRDLSVAHMVEGAATAGLKVTPAKQSAAELRKVAKATPQGWGAWVMEQAFGRTLRDPSGRGEP